MNKKVTSIIEGWSNHLFPKDSMKELINIVHLSRMEICNMCPENSKIKDPKAILSICTKCGCPLVTKTKALTVSCPLDKWGPVLTQEEKNAFEEQIKANNETKL